MGISSHLNTIYMNHISILISYIGIGPLLQSITSLHIAIIYISLLETLLIFYKFQGKLFDMCLSSESAILSPKQTSYTSYWLNFIQGRQCANPCALILNIKKGATDHSCQKVAVEQNSKHLL